MTNEEKTKKICGRNCTYNSKNCQKSCETFNNVLEMAQRKDNQHAKEKQQWIEKACEWWKNELTYPTMTQEEIDWYQTKIAEFKKAMKG